MWNDIRPYVCLVRACNVEDELYPTDRALREHSTRRHDEAGFLHQGKKACPLCMGSKTSPKHLMEHFKELALFALPAPLYDEDDHEYDEDDEDDEEEFTAAFASSTRVSIDSMLPDDASVRANSGFPGPSQRLTRSAVMRHADGKTTIITIR